MSLLRPWGHRDPPIQISSGPCPRTIVAMEVRLVGRTECGALLSAEIACLQRTTHPLKNSAVYDYQEVTPEGQVLNKLVFLNWSVVAC